MSLATRLRTRTKAHEPAAPAFSILQYTGKPSMAAVIKSSEALPERRMMVYKAADGAVRWLSRASTAFEDKDGEIVSKAALKSAAQKIMDGTPVPLRLYHIGTKGEVPPIDIGLVDLAFLCGETLYAGGTVKAGCEILIQANPEQSIGFLPLDNKTDKTYDSIDIKEISVCPVGRARNYLTGVALT